jgi:hypothetical protein
MAPAPAAPACCSVARSAPSGLILGDKVPDFSEIILPRVNLVQNIGELKNSFPSGTLVLNQQIILFVPPLIDAKTNEVKRQATPPLTMTVLGFRPTRYVEKVAGGGRGIVVNTEAEVRSNGGTLDYQEWKLKAPSGMKRFEYLADALVLIQAPEGEAGKDPIFSFTVDGKQNALAMWAMKGVVYTAAAKRVFFTARSIGALKTGGYPSWCYSITTREEQYPGGNCAWVPVCLPKAKNTPELLEFARNVLTAPPATPDEPAPAVAAPVAAAAAAAPAPTAGTATQPA